VRSAERPSLVLCHWSLAKGRERGTGNREQATGNRKRARGGQARGLSLAARGSSLVAYWIRGTRGEETAKTADGGRRPGIGVPDSARSSRRPPNRPNHTDPRPRGPAPGGHDRGACAEREWLPAGRHHAREIGDCPLFSKKKAVQKVQAPAQPFVTLARPDRVVGQMELRIRVAPNPNFCPLPGRNRNLQGASHAELQVSAVSCCPQGRRR